MDEVQKEKPEEHGAVEENMEQSAEENSEQNVIEPSVTEDDSISIALPKCPDDITITTRIKVDEEDNDVVSALTESTIFTNLEHTQVEESNIQNEIASECVKESLDHIGERLIESSTEMLPLDSINEFTSVGFKETTNLNNSMECGKETGSGSEDIVLLVVQNASEPTFNTETVENVQFVDHSTVQTEIPESPMEIGDVKSDTIENVAYNSKDKIPASIAVPIMTETILNALSELHGENTANLTNGVSLCDSHNPLAGIITPETLKKVANENILTKPKQTVKPVGRRGRPALNDKQLLAILQDGSDSGASTRVLAVKDFRMRKQKNVVEVNLEREIVLKQIREFPRKRKSKETIVDKIEDVKIPKVVKKKQLTPSKESNAPLQTSTPTAASCADISSLLNEWTDDEPIPPSTLVDSETLTEPNIDLSNNISLNNTTNGESFVKPKRVSRIIKKKIIYDPDNPQTFKFASDIVQAAITSAEVKPTKQQAAESKQQKLNENKLNKSVSETQQTKTVDKQMKAVGDAKASKTPNISKNAVKKRLTEVDRLLMDEGAVNMLYQMEQSNNEGEMPLQDQNKKKKSISNEKKVKIIKKAVINHSKTNADLPVKVFRVRKERTDSANNSKVAAVTAVRASMQSPSLSEMSGVSVNESRIIRRHSSSSFSSGCLSPRPQSPAGDVINKTLNSTNDSGIQDKSIKRKGTRQKKLSKTSDKSDSSLMSTITALPDVAALQMKSFTQLSMDISDNITHITVSPTGNSEELYDYQVITELTAAVRLCTSGTNALLLSSSQGTLCAGLDLRGLLQTTPEQQRHYAEQLLDAFRELMVALCECRSALVCCIGGACVGPGVALLTLCDLALASDRATFCVTPRVRRRLPPEGASLLTRPYALPPQIGRELVLCGRKLTASEALQRGLVSRTLWPDNFIEEVRSIVGDLSQHPAESFSIMKNILRRGEVTAVTSALRHEGRLLVDFWCSSEGQDAIRETHANIL